jgi:hypothetical protein
MPGDKPMIAAKPTSLIVELVTDPAEIRNAQARQEHFERNLKWFQAHAQEIYTAH